MIDVRLWWACDCPLEVCFWTCSELMIAKLAISLSLLILCFIDIFKWAHSSSCLMDSVPFHIMILNVFNNELMSPSPTLSLFLSVSLLFFLPKVSKDVQLRRMEKDLQLHIHRVCSGLLHLPPRPLPLLVRNWLTSSSPANNFTLHNTDSHVKRNTMVKQWMPNLLILP